MPNFKVQSIVSQEQWSSNHGPMLSWNLGCINTDTGQPEVIQVNSKPNNSYSVGASFFALPTGDEYQGIKKYKRQQPPQGNGSQPNGQPASSPAAAQPGFMLGGGTPKPAAMPYADALTLMTKLAKEVGLELGSEYAGRLLVAILRGEVENPIKPKIVVRFMGADIETAGVTQAQWNNMMPLCERYAKLTDDKALRALLIATCQVTTRKALTFDNAALFIEALRLSIAAEEAKQAPPPTDADFSPEDF